MKTILALSLYAVCLAIISCKGFSTHKSDSDPLQIEISKDSIPSKPLAKKMNSFDTVFYIFPDKSNFVNLHVFRFDDINIDSNNSVLSVISGDSTKFSDSLYRKYHNVELRDFNDDGVNDLLLFYDNGGRANPPIICS